MARVSVCLLLCVSVLLSNGYFYRGSPYKFRYSRPLLSRFFRRAGDDECSVCYGNNDCIVFNQARCEFYTATSELLAEDDIPDSSGPNSSVRSAVDNLMMNLVEQASTAMIFKECIPYISQFTDCTKETICLGCKSCSCSDDGRWNCTVKDSCRPDDSAIYNHRTLVIVMESLKSDGKPSFRLKRSIQSFKTGPASRFTYEQLSDWMYESGNSTKNQAEPGKDHNETTINVNAIDDDVATVNNSTGLAKLEPDYLDFEEVLYNIGAIDKGHNHRKPLNTFSSHDYMALDDDNSKVNHIKEAVPFIQVLNAVENEDDNYVANTELITENTTKVVIDLLESARRKINTEWKDHNDISTTTENILEAPNDIGEFNIFNIMKRDVSQVINTAENVTTTTPVSETASTSELPLGNITSTTEVSNGTKAIYQLKNNVYYPLDDIIKNKQSELKELVRIREQLVEFLKATKNDTNSSDINETTLKRNISKSFFSLYKVEILPLPEKEGDALRMPNGNNVDTYLDRLKRDILVVIRDIVVIQKTVGMQNFPPDLKLLIRAMKHYVHYNGKTHQKKHQRAKEIESRIEEDSRRHWMDFYPMTKNIVKKHLTQILEIMDKDMPQSNALIPLSAKSKEVIMRVIKNNRYDDLSSDGLRVSDPHYNLTNDLKTIGTKWQSMTTNIVKSSQWDKLYYMKLLHLVLKSDINKMTDALALLDFAHSRRMTPILDPINDSELKRIDHDLKSIRNKINKIINFRITDKELSNKKSVNILTVSQSTKKETFLKHIRDLLRNSKKDIVNLLQKKVPKTDIVKELAKKKLDEITKKKLVEYENVMEKWQSNLNIDNRQKRSIFDTITSRIKNILPKYLRGKVHSGMNNSTKNKKSRNGNGKKHGKRNQRKHGTSNKTSSKTGTKASTRTRTKTSTVATTILTSTKATNVETKTTYVS